MIRETEKEAEARFEKAFDRIVKQTPEEMLREFHAAARDERGRGEPNLRAKLIAEEFDETMKELGFEGEHDYQNYYHSESLIEKAALAKELADLVVVAYGTADAFDIPLEKVLAEVHRSNMTKFPECPSCEGKGSKYISKSAKDWKIRRVACEPCNSTGRIKTTRADGKILKPDTYEEADVEKILKEA